MKTKTLAILLILAGWFALAPGSLKADENEWYQGQQGQWVHQGNRWRWESTHGDDWYQGHQGHWYKTKHGWEWYSNDGDDYVQGHNGWQWQKHPDHDRDHDHN
ncbi:MAG TPA: hypothetical protein VNU00_05650 [Candidatus Binataceae bacterium]|jgi:hypothetical protein|nr:hypothetical protein [Candidatus Binataceae bacterium]